MHKSMILRVNREGPRLRGGPIAVVLLVVAAASCGRAGDAAPEANQAYVSAPKDEAKPATSTAAASRTKGEDSGWGGEGEPAAPAAPPAEPSPDPPKAAEGVYDASGTDDGVYDAPKMPRGPTPSPPPPARVANKPMDPSAAAQPSAGAAEGFDLDGDGVGGGGSAAVLNLRLSGSADVDTGGGRGRAAPDRTIILREIAIEGRDARNRMDDAEQERSASEERKRALEDEYEQKAMEQQLDVAKEKDKKGDYGDVGAEEPEEPEDEEEVDALTLGRRRLDVTRLPADDALTYVHPDKLLPRMFYFENTYLGGSAAYRERLIRLDQALREGERPYRLAYSTRQPFDPPATSGLEVTADLDAPYFDQPRRVFLQVGLRGSPRYGWRRPPLDVVLVVDGPALNQAPEAVTDMVVSLLAKLGPADRLGVVVADGEPRVFTELARLERARTRLAVTLDELPAAAPRRYDGDALGRAMARAGDILADASADTAIVPGTQTVLVVTAGNDTGRVASATRAAHALTLQGAVTSVFALDRSPERGGWWQVANAGHGNYHHLGDATTGQLVSWELESLARVVARLVRVNIRLGKTAGAIRVLGTRVLDEQEVAQVKAREEATDQNLSRSMGITSDRGEDDDGIQTVIPYFYGDDSHVILVELWVDGPGPIADVTVKYKDMVNLGNATARTSVRIDSLPRPETPESELIAKNVAGFELAEALQRASHRVKHGDPAGAARQLSVARQKARLTDRQDARVVQGFEQLVEDQSWTWDADRRAAVSESLELAGERRVGESGGD